MLMRQMSEHLQRHQKVSNNDVAQLIERAEEAHRQSEAIRRLLTEREPLGTVQP